MVNRKNLSVVFLLLVIFFLVGCSSSDNVVKDNSVVSKNEVKKEMPLVLEPIKNIIDNKQYEKNSPQWVFAEYMRAWYDRDFTRMATFTQLSWKAKEKNPADLLNSWFDGLTLQGVKIVKIDRVNSAILKNAAFDIEAIATIKNYDGKIITKVFTMRLIPENDKLEVDSAGNYGINPESGLNLFSGIGL